MTGSPRSEDIAAAIADRIVRLGEMLDTYLCDAPVGAGPRAHVLLRHAPSCGILSRLAGTREGLRLAGLSQRPGHFVIQGRVPQPETAHAQLHQARAKTRALLGLDALRDELIRVPLLAHDALQIDLEFHPAHGEARSMMRLAIEGISLSATLLSPTECGRAAGAQLASLSLHGRHNPDAAAWGFFRIQDHIVAAPDAALAWFKLHALIQRRPLGAEDFLRFLADPVPVVARLEDPAEIEAAMQAVISPATSPRVA